MEQTILADLEAARAANVTLEEQAKWLLDLIEHDRTGLAAGLVKVKRAIEARGWVLDGRGCYEWDDDRYREEAGIAMREAIKIAETALSESGFRVTEAFENRPFLNPREMRQALLKAQGAMAALIGVPEYDGDERIDRLGEAFDAVTRVLNGKKTLAATEAADGTSGA